MKRSRFMGTVSRKALIGKDVAKHKALASLSPEFREAANVKWFGPKVPPDNDGMVLSMIRKPNDEPNPTTGVSFVFVDRAHYEGDPKEISQDQMAKFWVSCLDHIRPLPVDLYQVGPVVWDDLEFSIPSDWTAMRLGLKHADEALIRAHQAALFSAFVSNVGDTDLELVNVAIASFVQAHPAFANVVDEGKWHRPYGERTAYMLLRQG
jgi:hypothetical protein